MRHNRPRIMIADDHAFVADACKKLLEPEYDIVATVGDGRALFRIAATLKPQVIILDIGMPLLNGLDAGRQIKQILGSAKLVFDNCHPQDSEWRVLPHSSNRKANGRCFVAPGQGIY
jgi:DNA-binding NarL/FixJ family response regulator